MMLELPPALEQELKTLAIESRRSVDQLAQQALESFIAYNRDVSQAVKRGRADIAAGRLLSSEEVLSRIERNFAAS
jgi:predicted transcriptional regulator